MSADAARSFAALRCAAEGREPHARLLPEETPVALVHDGSTTAVMMATPSDLEDFALGFTFTEGLAAPQDVREIEVVRTELGAEARIWLTSAAGAALIRRRRAQVGPTGCGLCGIESLEEARRPSPVLASSVRVTCEQVEAAVASLAGAQPLGQATRATHAAGYWTVDEGLVLVREDVGRHNALDKLIGALLRRDARRDGVVVLTSRVSIEMVQKAAAFGAEVLAAVSAPTALAVETAQAAGMTLIGVARADGFEVFCGEERIRAA